MAASNFAACMAVVFAYEGGFVNDPRDPGGATNYGITQKTLSGHRGHPVTVEDVRNLSRAEAEEIYRTSYWSACRGDELPAGVDLAVFDFGVNSGPIMGAKALQRALGQREDGHIGPITLAALMQADDADVVKNVSAARRAFLRRLRTFSRFGKDWTRRVTGVEAKALGMVVVPVAQADVTTHVTTPDPASAPALPDASSTDLPPSPAAAPVEAPVGAQLIMASDQIEPDTSPAPDSNDVKPSRLKGAHAIIAAGIGLSGSALSSASDQIKSAADTLHSFASSVPLAEHVCIGLTVLGVLAGAAALVKNAMSNEDL